jgi:predicted phage terminase large subunit-like protein
MTNSLQSRQAASAELIIRRRARADIFGYVRAIDIPGRPASEDPETESFLRVESRIAAHHELLLAKLEEISTRPHGRLMVFMPPGSAKSTYASVVFPSRYLGQVPDRRLILASYGDDLARKMGRRTRAIIRQPRYKGIMGAELVRDSQAAQEFALTNGSEYMAAGILSGITGNRAHGIVIDDPVKGREQAESETIRTKTWEAYQDDILSRLIPGGWVCIIQTRWHQDDLSGRILPMDWKGQSGPILCQDGNVWEVICLQARCEIDGDPLGRARGEYLWPEWFDRKHWAQFEINPRTWSALYQQMPTPREGDLFKPDMIKIIDAIPADVQRRTRAWDFGATEGGGDYTVGGDVGKLADGRTLIADIVRFQGGPDRVQSALKNTADLDGYTMHIRIPQDPGQAGKAQVQTFTRLLSGYKVTALPVTGDKVTRAEGFAAQVNAGNVVMLRAPWNNAVIEELRVFPNGSHDDIVDALSDGFNDVHSRPAGFFG